MDWNRWFAEVSCVKGKGKRSVPVQTIKSSEVSSGEQRTSRLGHPIPRKTWRYPLNTRLGRPPRQSWIELFPVPGFVLPIVQNAASPNTNCASPVLQLPTYIQLWNWSDRVVTQRIYGADNLGNVVLVPAGPRKFSLRQNDQNGSGAHYSLLSIWRLTATIWVVPHS